MRSPVASPRAFASLVNPRFRWYFLFATAAIMADSVEHVISYWVMFQKFHSPALGGFAVISHWAPHLLFAAWSGALADRMDVRRLIQLGMGLLLSVSVGWGVIFATDTVAVWKAVVLLIVHGSAGVFWLPAAQVLIHELVDHEQLPSAVRLNATSRYIGFLLGPALGAGLLLAFGSTWGIWINALIYLPMLIWVVRIPYRGPRHAPPRAVRGLRDILIGMRTVAARPVLLSMTLLAGAASFFIGNAYQAQMPGFATLLGQARADFLYSLLLAADAAGGLAAGVMLETRGLLPPKPRTAFVLAMAWATLLGAFALSSWYWVSVVVLFVAGFVELAFNAMAQTLVQLNAPGDMRGRVIGVFTMAALGMRFFSGISTGVVGAIVGIRLSLAVSAAALLLVCIMLAAWLRRR
ncbi:MAG: MFS transporter [Proteobacteria bacterium]|nr:MFS transporter [Pseudomonadota bacterium]